MISRRDLFPVAAAGMLAGYAGFKGGTAGRSARLGNASVAILKAASYSEDLVSRMLQGIRELKLNPRGLKVLLKPNLVEFDPHTCINTDVAVVAAAYEVFKTLGASEVIIGEGPGHRRDTCALAEMARYRGEIEQFDARFVDLNRDDVSPVIGFADRPEMYFPTTALRADLIVSLAKMKTHHWAGATLAMKNFFGLVPGNVYGWPKNELHHIGIDRSIFELSRVFHHSFAIIDGIVGMEGNGPIQGSPKPAGVLVMGSDLPAVDATCCRIMGIDPGRLEYLRLASDRLGVTEEARIEQRGETIRSVRTNFNLIQPFENYRLA
ncbi:MAG TPA: DUF362 domain-containing protein [Bryobacteraceae bacterium]|jgi:uncharacterized protein (DUF362 family)|nr:DUF362 domain-containing protein [Bryobacteraceae bacterium]